MRQADFAFDTLCLKIEEKSQEMTRDDLTKDDAVVVISSGHATRPARQHRRAKSDANRAQDVSTVAVPSVSVVSSADHPPSEPVVAKARPQRSSVVLPHPRHHHSREGSDTTATKSASTGSADGLRSPRRKGSGKKKGQVTRVVALADFQPQDNMGGLLLSLKKGDFCVVKDKNPSGWWWGYVENQKLEKGLLKASIFDESQFVYEIFKK